MSNNNTASPETGGHILPPSRILYADAQCMAINKLCGEAVEGAGPGMYDLPRMIALSLNDNLADYKESCLSNTDRLPLPSAVHRLDVPVTGCTLFALTHKALAFLNGVFTGAETAGGEDGRSIKKIYWAIVEKPPAEIPPAMNLVHWLQFDSARNKSTAYDKPYKGGKKAALAYRVTGAGQNYLFLEIELFSGRHHQIRSQLERIGLHIKGDLKYRARRSEAHGGIRLHARSLDFPHPVEGKNISVSAEPPLMDNLWQAFKSTYPPLESQ